MTPAAHNLLDTAPDHATIAGMPKKRPSGSAARRKVEIYSAGCAVCEQTITMVKLCAGPSDEVIIHDTKDIRVATRAKRLGIRTIPAVVIEGTLTGCCAGRGCDEAILRARGLGQPLSRR